MCGISGFIVKPGAKITDTRLQLLADNLLKGIDHRGGDATGYAVRTKTGEVVVEKAACDTKSFLQERKRFPEGVQSVLLHTRFATQGHQAFPANNHPVRSDHYLVVHNGHIYNDDKVIDQYGFDRLGKVDSEAIAHAFRAKGFKQAELALEALEGNLAVAVMDDRNGEIVLARGASSPLIVLETKHLVVWASEAHCITDAWKAALGTPPRANSYKYLREGDMILYRADGTKQTRDFVPNDYYGSWSYGNYDSQAWGGESEGTSFGPWEPVQSDGRTIYIRQKFGPAEKSAFARSMNPGKEDGINISRCGACRNVCEADELTQMFSDEDFWICLDCEDWLIDQEIKKSGGEIVIDPLADISVKGITDKMSIAKALTSGQEVKVLDTHISLNPLTNMKRGEV